MSNTTLRTLEIIATVAVVVIAFTVVILLFPSMKSADVASWVQAGGAIVAVGASFGFFYAQKRNEMSKAEAETILTMTQSVIAVLSLCRKSITAMKTAFDQMECRHMPGVIPFSREYFDDLRILFSQFIGPAGDFMSVQVALEFSEILMEAKHDFDAANDDDLFKYIIDRSHERLDRAREHADRLQEHLDELLKACKQHGVNPIAGPLKRPPTDKSGSAGGSLEEPKQ